MQEYFDIFWKNNLQRLHPSSRIKPETTI